MMPMRKSLGSLSRVACTTGAIIFGVASPGVADGDFLRGDSNGDGAVSISDAHYTLSYLFRGGAEPGCHDAADLEDNSTINITDPIRILNFVALGGGSPCLPFPAPGADPGADDLECDSPASGSPLEDPAARMAIIAGTVGPDGKAALTVRVSNGRPIAGYWGKVTAEGGILANGARPEVADLSGTFDNGFKGGKVVAGALHFGFLAALTEPASLPAGQNADVLSVTVCLARGTKAGAYALTLEAAELVDDESGRAIRPVLAGAVLTVSSDVGATAGCIPENDSPANLTCGSGSPPPPPPPPPPPGPDVDFTRGDSNSDGAVTMSDAHYTLSYLFIGHASSLCERSADYDDDGTINITDPVRLLNHVVLGGPPPCDPFPGPGPDTTEDRLRCAAYGGGTPLEDAGAKLEIERAVAGTDGFALISIAVASSRSIAGYHAVISAEGGILANGQAADDMDDVSGSLNGGFIGASTVGGKLHIGFLASLTEPASIPAGPLDRVLNVLICLAQGSRAGSHALTIESGELIDFETGRAVRPALQGAVLTLAEDLAEGAGCAPETDEGGSLPCGSDPPPPPPPPGPDVDFLRGDTNADGRRSISDPVMIQRFLFLGDRQPPCVDSADTNDTGNINITDTVWMLNYLFLNGPAIPLPSGPLGPDPTPDELPCSSYDVEPADETDEMVRLGAVTGAPGTEVEIPVFLTNRVPVEAFQLVIEYDPAVFTPLERLRFGGTFYENKVDGSFQALRVRAGEDVFVVGFIPNLTEPGFETPPGTDRLVFKVPGTIHPNAVPGTEVLLQPTNGPGGEGTGPERLLNELTHEGDARYFSTIPELEGAVLGIVGDQTFFIRGDSDGNSAVDMADSVHTLGHLFLGEGPLSCRDAADANDDGDLDITDPIYVLNHLFRGGASMPPPFPAAGPDPTPDALECPRR